MNIQKAFEKKRNNLREQELNLEVRYLLPMIQYTINPDY